MAGAAGAAAAVPRTRFRTEGSGELPPSKDHAWGVVMHLRGRLRTERPHLVLASRGVDQARADAAVRPCVPP